MEARHYPNQEGANVRRLINLREDSVQLPDRVDMLRQKIDSTIAVIEGERGGKPLTEIEKEDVIKAVLEEDFRRRADYLGGWAERLINAT